MNTIYSGYINDLTKDLIKEKQLKKKKKSLKRENYIELSSDFYDVFH